MFVRYPRKVHVTVKHIKLNMYACHVCMTFFMYMLNKYILYSVKQLKDIKIILTLLYLRQ